MKILMICDFFAPGLSYQENMLAKYYLRAGHQVVIITSQYTSVFEFINEGKQDIRSGLVNEKDGLKLYRQPYRINLLNRIRSFSGVAEIINAELPDVLFMHDISPNLFDMVRYKKKTNIPLLLDYHADYSNSGANFLSLKILHGVIRKAILSFALPHVDRIFPVVPASSEFLHEIYGVPLHRLELLPLGFDVDAQKAVSDNTDRDVLRQALGVRPQDILIFTGGKFHPYKQTEKLLQVLAELDAPNLHLVIIGSDQKNGSEYGALISEMANTTPRTLMTGWLSTEETYQYMLMSDIAVFPGSQSVLWQQCIGMHLPLILGRKITEASKPQDVNYLNREDNIMILDPAKPVEEELRRCILAFINDDELRQRMAAGARKVSDDYLGWDKIALMTLDRISASGEKKL